MPPLFARAVMHFKCRDLEENPFKQKIRAAGQMPAQKQISCSYLQTTLNLVNLIVCCSAAKADRETRVI